MLVIIRGLPGSGKTTLARMFEAQGYVHVEKDKLRTSPSGEYKYDKTQNPRLEQECLDLTMWHLNAGRDVVVSNCNEALYCVEQYIKLANLYGWPWTVIETKGRFGSRYGTDDEVGIPRRAAAWEHFPVL
jgi:predicted kinase